MGKLFPPPSILMGLYMYHTGSPRKISARITVGKSNSEKEDVTGTIRTG